LGGRPVAALIYRYRLHIINLFTWPTEGVAAAAPQFETRQGYNMVHWIKANMEYWAVSDVAPSELERFAQLARQGQFFEPATRLAILEQRVLRFPNQIQEPLS
jgi:anti-sigma factor RsiW